mgnify:CR=1 FL=1
MLTICGWNGRNKLSEGMELTAGSWELHIKMKFGGITLKGRNDNIGFICTSNKYLIFYAKFEILKQEK